MEIAASNLAAFLGATVLLHLTPGPIMLLLFHQTLRDGLAGGFQAYLGIAIGEIFLVSIVAAALIAASELPHDAMKWLSRAGAMFLLYCAISAWRDAGRGLVTVKKAPSTERKVHEGHAPSLVTTDAVPEAAGCNALLAGLATAFSNPATLLFFAAFFAQFVDWNRKAPPQIAALALLYIVSALCFDLACVMAAARPCKRLRGIFKRGAINRVSAVAYSTIAAGALMFWS